MSKNSAKPQIYSTAPSAPDDFQRGPPPPSYEECLKMNGAAGTTPHQYTYSNPTPYQQQQAFLPPPTYPAPGSSSTYGYAHQYTYSNPTPYQQQQTFLPPPTYPALVPSSSYGYANPYQTHIQQQQIFYNTTSTSPQSSTSKMSAENVIYLAKGAKVRTTANGAISIPPPPPGCAPTPGQLAAMSGQPVMIKKDQKSFF